MIPTKNWGVRLFSFSLFLLALGLCIVAASCQTQKKEVLKIPTATQTDSLGSKSLTLEVAKSGTLRFEAQVKKEDQIYLEFAKVLGDSRCPKDVNCVWAGNVQIAVNLAVNEKKNDWRILSIGARALSKLEFEGYTFELVEVNPYPTTQNEKSTHPYSAKIKVYPTPTTSQ